MTSGSDPEDLIAEVIAAAQGQEDAAAAALARAQARAVERGLRPGMKPRRRRRPTEETSLDGRDPQLLGDQIGALVSERGWEVDLAAGSVMGRWPAIVGVDVAAHCAPVSFELGVLTVRAESTAWATQLRLMSQLILGRLAETAGPEVVTELVIVGPSAPSWSKGPRKVSDGRGPRDTYG